MGNYGTGTAPIFGTGTISFFVIIWVISVIAAWQVFVKAGKPGWAAIIPIYNIIILMEIIGKPIWWFLLWFVPCINYVFIVWSINLLSKSFGKGVGFTLGLIFLGPIFIMILAFSSDSVYLGPSAKEANMNNRFGSDDYQRPFGEQS